MVPYVTRKCSPDILVMVIQFKIQFLYLKKKKEKRKCTFNAWVGQSHCIWLKVFSKSEMWKVNTKINSFNFPNHLPAPVSWRSWTYIIVNHVTLFSPCPFLLFFLLSHYIKSFTHRDSSACFRSHLDTGKQSTLFIIDVGIEGKPNGAFIFYFFN